MTASWWSVTLALTVVTTACTVDDAVTRRVVVDVRTVVGPPRVTGEVVVEVYAPDPRWLRVLNVGWCPVTLEEQGVVTSTTVAAPDPRVVVLGGGIAGAGAVVLWNSPESDGAGALIAGGVALAAFPLLFSGLTVTTAPAPLVRHRLPERRCLGRPLPGVSVQAGTGTASVTAVTDERGFARFADPVDPTQLLVAGRDPQAVVIAPGRGGHRRRAP